MKHKLRIKEARKKLQMTQAELAAALGISRSYLSDIENGKFEIGLDLFLDICEVTNLCPRLLVNTKKCEGCTSPNKKYCNCLG